MAPFVLVLLADGSTHGYALIGRLKEMGIAEGEIDVGQVYKTLRCLERLGHVASTWSAEPTGPQHRDYELTDAGRAALDEWAAVMSERARLIDEFEARYRRCATSTGLVSRRSGGEQDGTGSADDPRGARSIRSAPGVGEAARRLDR
jgi:DNA-binding PadR family transcriptional regulator